MRERKILHSTYIYIHSNNDIDITEYNAKRIFNGERDFPEKFLVVRVYLERAIVERGGKREGERRKKSHGT